VVNGASAAAAAAKEKKEEGTGGFQDHRYRQALSHSWATIRVATGAVLVVATLVQAASL
jgi:hypothetical protein